MGAAVRKALILFVILDAVFVAGAIVLYFALFRPQLIAVESRLESSERRNTVLLARMRTVEARHALGQGDREGARTALRDTRDRLARLLGQVPKDRPAEVERVKALLTRTGLVESEFDRDPGAARQDLELLDAGLAELASAPEGSP
jgi:hypothetical protein